MPPNERGPAAENRGRASYAVAGGDSNPRLYDNEWQVALGGAKSRAVSHLEHEIAVQRYLTSAIMGQFLAQSPLAIGFLLIRRAAR